MIKVKIKRVNFNIYVLRLRLGLGLGLRLSLFSAADLCYSSIFWQGSTNHWNTSSCPYAAVYFYSEVGSLYLSFRLEMLTGKPPEHIRLILFHLHKHLPVYWFSLAYVSTIGLKENPSSWEKDKGLYLCFGISFLIFECWSDYFPPSL